MNPDYEIQALKQTIAELEAELANYKCNTKPSDDFMSHGEHFIWILTNDLKFSHIDIAIKKVTGFSSDELIGTDISNFLTASSFSKLKEALKTELTMIKSSGNHDSDKLLRLVLEGVTKGNNKIWYEVKLKYILDSDKEPTGVFMHTKDITSQKKIEDIFSKKYETLELRSKLLLDTASEILPISIFVYNMKTKKPWNQESKIYKYLGYTLTEWKELTKGKEFSDLIDPNDKEKLEDVFKRLEKNKTTVESGEFRIKDKVGNWHIFYTKVTPLTKDKDGSIIEVIGFDYDITYVKNLEKEIALLKSSK